MRRQTFWVGGDDEAVTSDGDAEQQLCTLQYALHQTSCLRERGRGERGLQTLNSLERASQEEQNIANFSFIAPSSEELWVRKLASHSNAHVW